MARPHNIAGMVMGIVLAAALGAGGYLLHRAGDASAQLSGPPGPMVPPSSMDPAAVSMAVEGAEVFEGTLTLTVAASGEAEARRRAVLTSEVAGTVERVAVRESEWVVAGEVVAALNAADQRLALDEARTAVREAQSRYRERLLLDADLPADLRRTREAAARLHSGLERADIQLRRAQLALERTRLRAPFDGRVASIKVVAGQRVAPGSELMTLLDVDPVTVQARVLEGDLAQLKPGGRAGVRFSAFPDEVFAGHVETINPVVDSNTRSARVTVRVPNPAGRILPGMYARVTLDSRQLTDRVLVPRGAILERDGRTMLFVDVDGRARWRYVTTGESNEEYVEIVGDPGPDGVDVGDVVLTGGHFTLTHGARIRVVDGGDTEEDGPGAR